MNYEVDYKSLNPLLKPRTIAVLGASESRHKIGNMQLQALIDGKFQGEIIPIHPTAKEISGLTSYPSLDDVPMDIDLVIFCVNYSQIKDGLIACAKKNVKSAIIFASGFSETGEAGEKLQRELGDYARQHGIRLVGPNCVGLVNTSNGLIGTFSPAILNVPMNGKKGVGYVSQSGAFGVLTYMAAAQQGVMFNYFISTGNEMDATFEDFVEYMIHDEDTKVISGYLEGTKKPEKLKLLAQQALTKKKPILVMKTGRSDAGSRAVASHTGSLAGSDKIYDAFFKQYGIIRVDDYEDIISFAKLFNPEKLPTGKNTVIITSSGGRGINEADRCEGLGLNIAELSEETKAEIRKGLPEYASVSNPIDLTAAAMVTNPEYYLIALKALVNDPKVDNIVFTDFPYAWNNGSPLLDEFVAIAKASNKVIGLFPFPLEGMTYPPVTPLLEEHNIAVISGTLNPIRALAKLVAYSEHVRVHTQKEVMDTPAYKLADVEPLLKPGSVLSECEASDVLDCYGIPTTKRAVAKNAEEAVQIATSIGFPVVMKIDSSDIPHKTEADAIRLNIVSEEEVRNAFEEVMLNAKAYNPTAVLNGVSVQEMLPSGVEVIIGAHNDDTFGPVVMAGVGGTFVEVFKDIAFKVVPLSRKDAEDLLEELQGKAILNGARGKVPVDKEAIIDVLLKVSSLMDDNRQSIKELDINPLIVYEKGIKAADAMLVVQENVSEIQVIGG